MVHIKSEKGCLKIIQTPLYYLHLKLREIEIIVLYVRNNVCIVHKYHTPA